MVIHILERHTLVLPRAGKQYTCITPKCLKLQCQHQKTIAYIFTATNASCLIHKTQFFQSSQMIKYPCHLSNYVLLYRFVEMLWSVHFLTFRKLILQSENMNGFQERQPTKYWQHLRIDWLLPCYIMLRLCSLFLYWSNW